MVDDLELKISYSVIRNLGILYGCIITVIHKGLFATRDIFLYDGADVDVTTSSLAKTHKASFSSLGTLGIKRQADRKLTEIADAYASLRLPPDRTVIVTPDGTITTKEVEDDG